MDPRENSSSLFVLVMLGVFVLLFPTSTEQASTSTETDTSSELARLEKRVEQAEGYAEHLNSQLSDLENFSTIKLLHQELDVVEAGVDPTGSWGNYYLILLEKLNREHADFKEMNKLLDRMVSMTKKGKYFFPEQVDNMEAFYQDVERLRPKK
jgi:septal ring factor EnvC (AmiA/AmiB activator)